MTTRDEVKEILRTLPEVAMEEVLNFLLDNLPEKALLKVLKFARSIQEYEPVELTAEEKKLIHKLREEHFKD